MFSTRMVDSDGENPDISPELFQQPVRPEFGALHGNGLLTGNLPGIDHFVSFSTFTMNLLADDPVGYLR